MRGIKTYEQYTMLVQKTKLNEDEFNTIKKKIERWGKKSEKEQYFADAVALTVTQQTNSQDFFGNACPLIRITP